MSALSTELVFVNGTAMKGGVLHHNLAEAEFVGESATVPRYRFYSIRDDFPGLRPDALSGASISGEVYRVDLGTIAQRFLPEEPGELELSLLELEDGRYALAMILRADFEHDEGIKDITKFGGWRAYLASRELGK